MDISEICDSVLKTLVPDEREITTGKGKIFFMRVAPYRTTENKILGCVITLVDVTTQKQGQEKLQTTEERLSLAQQAIDTKSDYLSRIVHEIRTPMSTLMGLSRQAKLQLNDKETLSESLDKLHKTIEYMASIVSDISETSKNGHGDDDSVPREFNLKGCNVLIAEDNDLNRTILGAMLQHEGITFVEARDGEEAVDAFLSSPVGTFDCVLMDMRMPKLDGIKATTAIRDSGKADGKTIPIIGVSANGFADDVKQARLAGINNYTTKPIDRDNLLAAMSELIKK